MNNELENVGEIERVIDLWRQGIITYSELRAFILKALHLKLVGDTILIGSYCGAPVEEDK